jgi:hypothetical protein
VLLTDRLGFISLLTAARYDPGDCCIAMVQAVYNLTICMHTLVQYPVQYLQYNCCRLSGMPIYFMLGPLLMPDVT